MYHILIAIYVIICLFLIAVILLQAGRGGGLNEALGGSATSVLGTQAPTVLKRATEVSATLFLVLSLALAMMTARKGRSLFDQMRMPVMPVSSAQGAAQEAAPASSKVPSEQTAATTASSSVSKPVPAAPEKK